MGGQSLGPTASAPKSATPRPCILRSRYHDFLADSSSSTMPPNVCGTFLKSQLFGRARDLVHYLDNSLIESKIGVKHIFDAVQKSDPLTHLFDIFADFNKHISIRRGENKSFKNFEGRFASLVFKYSSHGNNNNIPESLTAFFSYQIKNLNTIKGSLSLLMLQRTFRPHPHCLHHPPIRILLQECLLSVLYQLPQVL